MSPPEPRREWHVNSAGPELPVNGERMTAWLHHPLVQSVAAPLAAALLVTLALRPVRLAGLAGGVGFLTAVWLIGNFALEPLTAARKLVLGGMAAIAIGALLDLVKVRLANRGCAVLGLVFGVCAIWVLWTVLVQPPLVRGLAMGAGAFSVTAWLVAGTVAAASDPIRSGAAGVALGLGSGVAATSGASALLGQYGIALGMGCAGFLLVAAARAGRDAPSAGLALTAAVIAGLVLCGAVALASLSWLAVALFALVPLAARLPLPRVANGWVRAALALVYTGIAAGLACAVAWWASHGGMA